jgi:hypothetical protein
MKLALLADVHANLEGCACPRGCSSAGSERYAFLGDPVGYGADPAVVDLVRSTWTGARSR